MASVYELLYCSQVVFINIKFLHFTITSNKYISAHNTDTEDLWDTTWG